MRSALTFIGRGVALAFWYLLVPVALTALTFRYLIPEAGDPRGGAALRWFARIAREQALVVAALVTLGFEALVAYWSRHLPGARAHELGGVPGVERAPGRRRAVLTVVAIAVAATGGVASGHAVRTARIVSTSMVPTILPGDRIWIDRLAYRDDRAPRRGDVIVFRHDGDGDDASEGQLVKRVVGVPGDHVTMVDSRPVVNGVPVPSCDAGTFVYFGASQFSRGHLAVEWLDDQPYLAVQEHGPHAFAGYDVRPGEVFVLGDNRGVSNDSRSWLRGPGVPLAAIDGRARRVLFGEDRRGRLDADRLWTELGTDLHLTGVDLASLRAGIARCLADGATRHAEGT